MFQRFEKLDTPQVGQRFGTAVATPNFQFGDAGNRFHVLPRDLSHIGNNVFLFQKIREYRVEERGEIRIGGCPCLGNGYLHVSCNSSMNKIIFYTLAFLFCLPTQAQQRFFGVIQDADGYTNVRDTSGTVIGKLLDNHVFVDWDAQKSHKEWHSVEYGAETGITKTCPNGNTHTGEIHKSRIRYLADLPQLKKQPQSTDKCLVYANDTLTIKIIFQKFNPQKHAIVYDLEAGFVRSIDGCSDLIGIDDNIPHEEYASVTVKHPAGILEFPTAYITHLYEPSRNNVVVALGKGNSLFISTQNSDGAGGYYAVWTVENYLVKSLFVLHDF